MNILFQLEIPKRNSHCVKGGERLSPGMEYYSLLLEEPEKVVRQDYCSVCWQATMEKDLLDKNRSYWQSRIEAKVEKPSNQSKIARAIALLQEMITQTDRKESELFVLVLFLARARQLLLRREWQENGVNYQLYEIAHLDQFITIKKMELSALEVTSTQEALSTLLGKN